jgi:NodT family efflux transporter outer membrane factor (OMF) lipoprotein
VFGRLRRGVEAATADEESMEASLYDVQVSLAAEVARGYFEVRSLQLRLGLARSNLERQGETVALARYREEAGLATSQDADQAKASREQLEALVPTLESGLTEAEHRLDVLLGKHPGALHERLAGGGRLPAVPDQVAIGIPAETLRQRPDVRAAERKLAAETARVGVATAALYPSFKLSGSIGVEAVAQTLIGNPAGAFYSLLGGISAPLFNRGRIRAQIAAQDAVREQTLVTYEQTVLGALEDVENALVALLGARERAEALARAAASAESAALVARERYASGLIDFQPVLDTQRNVQAAQDGFAGARADGVLALVRLYKALGGGWSAPVAPEEAHAAAERS